MKNTVSPLVHLSCSSGASLVPLSNTSCAPSAPVSVCQTCPKCFKMKNTVSPLVTISAPLVPLSYTFIVKLHQIMNKNILKRKVFFHHPYHVMVIYHFYIRLVTKKLPPF